LLGLDTNILVRYLTQDDPGQSHLATCLMEETLTPDRPGYVNHVVLCELVWVLEDCYGQSRSDLLKVLNQLLQVVELRFEDADAVRLAVADFREGKADFSDNLVARINNVGGCPKTYTFDKQASKEPGFILLK
jgi:predicted nucleic-acid-binding protein